MKGHERAGRSSEFRVLVENSEYWLSNIGDLAMMDVTIRRLRQRWPAAEIGVLTDTPHLLGAYFPQVVPVDPRASRAWTAPSLLVRLARKAGPRAVGRLALTYLTLRAWLPQKFRGVLRRSRRLLAHFSGRSTTLTVGLDTPGAGGARRPRRASPTSMSAAAASSLVLAMGGGYITDSDFEQTTRVFSLLEHAQRAGVPTAMVGQGLGPIEDPVLLAGAAAVLPTVGVIALRERRRGPEILERIGASASRVIVTGDDAIELAQSVRRPEMGRHLGICLRSAGYSPVTTSARGDTAAAIQTAATELDADLVPVIIAEYRNQDRRSTLPLLEGFSRAQRPLDRFARPQEVARQVGGCRVLVSGAYHAAVFALSQGIPVVALTSSEYYDDKFLGLADMFGDGLRLIHLDEQSLRERLHEAVHEAWQSAPVLRSRLLAVADEQVATSRKGFNRVFELIEGVSHQAYGHEQDAENSL